MCQTEHRPLIPYLLVKEAVKFCLVSRIELPFVLVEPSFTLYCLPFSPIKLAFSPYFWLQSLFCPEMEIQSRQLSISRGFSLQSRFSLEIEIQKWQVAKTPSFSLQSWFSSNELFFYGKNADFCCYIRCKFLLLIDLVWVKMVLLHFVAIWEASFSFWSPSYEWKSMNELLLLYEMKSEFATNQAISLQTDVP